jgi:prepilin-type N-terminal cleavage/methylation domain-containing protein
MKPIARIGKTAVTLTELLVVLVILGLLATLAVPVAVNRSRQAKFAVARAEIKALAQGIEICAMTHGFIVPLQLLDNIPADRITSIAGENDDLLNESTNIVLIEVGVNAFDQIIRPSRQVRLDDPNDTRVQTMIQTWAGPFTQWQRPFIGGGFLNPNVSTNLRLTSSQVRRDYPLDPWGHPYRLYSPIGIVGSGSAGAINTIPLEASLDTDSFSDGQITQVDDRFDRWAVVSFGPDGVSDQTTTSGGTAGDPVRGDDVIYFFLDNPRTESSFFLPAPLPTPDSDDDDPGTGPTPVPIRRRPPPR